MRMPAQKTYGKKRSRVIYDARAAFSSPDQPPPKTKPAQTEQPTPVIVKRVDLIKEDNHESNGNRRSPRRALGEKAANLVVLPLEAFNVVKEKKPKAKRKDAVKKGAAERAVKNGEELSRHSKVLVVGAAQVLEAPEEMPSGDKVKPTTPLRRNARRTAIDNDGRAEGRGRHTFFEDDEATEGPAKPQAMPLAVDLVSPEPRRSPRKAAKIEHTRAEQQTALQDTAIENRHLEDDPDVVRTSETPTTQILTRDPSCPYQQHCAGLLDLSTHPLTSFATWSEELSEHFAATKIAEASFGEVYRLSLLEDITDFCSTDESVFKIIALQPPDNTLPTDKRKRAASLRKAEAMSKPFDVANEVKLLQRMSSIPGFTNFRDVRILRGRPPEAFIGAFKAWNAEQKARKKELSHFPDPSKKASYNDDQLWAVIEMQDAGNDLERLVDQGACTSIWTVWDVFWQTVLSIAKGEECAEFEHRDLHLGNICVRSSPTADLEQPEEINTNRKLGFTSLETTIIDYTISRCLMSSNSTPSDAISENDIAYTDLSNPSQAALFEGDSTEEYQYDIYRYMRGVLYFDNPYAHSSTIHSFTPQQLTSICSGRNWSQFHPRTNLVWLHLVLYKLLEQLVWPSAKKAPARKNKKEYAVWKKANNLEFVLLKAQELLDPGVICENGIRSASDLVGFAVGEGWLDLEDVIGGGVDELALVSQLEGLELE